MLSVWIGRIYYTWWPNILQSKRHDQHILREKMQVIVHSDQWSHNSTRWESAKSNKWGDMKGTRSPHSDGKLPVILLRSITVPPLWGVWNFNHPQSRSILSHLSFSLFFGAGGGICYLHPMAVMALKSEANSKGNFLIVKISKETLSINLLKFFWCWSVKPSQTKNNWMDDDCSWQ